MDIKTSASTQLLDGDRPPSYHEASAEPSGSSEEVFPSTPRLLSTRYLSSEQIGTYIPPGSKLSDDQSTVTIKLAESELNVQALMKVVLLQAALPPKPIVCISGHHYDGGTGRKVADFNFSINMMPQIVRGPHQESWSYTKLEELPHLSESPSTPSSKKPLPTNDSLTLESYAAAFLADPAARKTFTLTREVSNWDTEFIAAQTHWLATKAGYKGNIEVSFPVRFSKVLFAAEGSQLSSPSSPSAGGSGGRAGSFFEWLLSGLGRRSTKDYPVIKAVWPYATSAPDRSGPEGQDTGNGERERRFAVQSEHAWWNEWKAVVRNAMLARRAGWLSVDDQLDVAMGVVVPPFTRGRGWK